jgi:hypothetical protein
METKKHKFLDWMDFSSNFDKVTFKKSIILTEFTSCQEIAFRCWNSIHIPNIEAKPEDPWVMNEELLLLYTRKLNKILPLNLFRKILRAIVLFNSDAAHKEFQESLDRISPLINFKDLAPSMEPLFGRTNINNAFLTYEGVEVSKRVLYLIREKYNMIECCLILPRVAQILLWFLEDYEVYAVLCTLIQDSQMHQESPYFSFVFPFTLVKHKQMVREVRNLLKYECNLDTEDMDMKPVIRDMIYNILVGYVRPDVKLI